LANPRKIEAHDQERTDEGGEEEEETEEVDVVFGVAILRW